MCCTIGQARNLFPIQWSGSLPLPECFPFTSLSHFLPVGRVLVFSFLEQDSISLEKVVFPLSKRFLIMRQKVPLQVRRNRG